MPRAAFAGLGTTAASSMMRSDKPCLFMPHYGEFGWFIMHHIRLVHFWECPHKIVCCRPGEELYFPSADEFEYDWEGFVRDEDRVGVAWPPSVKHHRRYIAGNEQLGHRLASKHNAPCIVQYWQRMPWVFQDVVFPIRPSLRQGLAVDVAVATRKRAYATDRNFDGWAQVVAQLRSLGLRVGLVGTRDQSVDCDADLKTWEHPPLGDAVVETLQQCRLFIGGDTGVAHLAAFLQIPMVVFGMCNDGMMLHMQNCNDEYCRTYRLDESYEQEDRRPLGPLLACEQRAKFIVEQTVQSLAHVDGRGSIMLRPSRQEGCRAAPKAIVHVFDGFEADADTSRRMHAAQITWRASRRNWGGQIATIEHRLRNGDRSSTDVGERKRTPFVKDVLDYALSASRAVDHFVYTNSDLSICLDAGPHIRESIDRWGCGFSQRVDFARQYFPKEPLSVASLARSRKAVLSPGADIFWFTRQWWEDHRADFPDALVGFEGWDFCMKHAMMLSGLPEPHVRLTYHETHTSYWETVLVTSLGQQYCRRVCTQWAIDHHLERYLLPDPEGYLFK